MKKRTEIDLPQINWVLNFIENWQEERIAKRKLREIAANKETPIKEQIRHMIRWPADDLEKALANSLKN